MKDKRRFLLIGGWIFVLFLLCFSVVSFCQKSIVVILKSEAEVMGSEIYLEEIVQDIEAEKDLKEKLKEVPVGSSPLPGNKRQLNRDYILVRLYQNGFSPGQVSIKGAYKVLIRRPALSLNKDEFTAPYPDKKKFLIKEGNEVKLVMESKYLRIVTEGRALEAGGKDDVIEVLNKSSFKRIKGKIIAPFIVKVVSPGVK